jgi:tetratricopeptide (TPR) repeat protein
MEKSREKAPLLPDAVWKRLSVLDAQGRYQESLDICLQITRTYPEIAEAWGEAAINCIKLDRCQEAINCAQTLLARGCDRVELYDVLAHAYSALGQWDETRRYGLQELNARDRFFSREPAIPPPEYSPLPPPSSARTREHNVIAFSLFGDNPKYYESAIFNVLEQPTIYPYWVCRFYIDGSVPENVIDRLHKGGAQIIQVEGTAAQWLGPMWLLLALNDPQAHRILFRDADSVISRREAGAVAQWIASGKRFHMMRDSGSYTELIMAGLGGWGDGRSAAAAGQIDGALYERAASIMAFCRSAFPAPIRLALCARQSDAARFNLRVHGRYSIPGRSKTRRSTCRGLRGRFSIFYCKKRFTGWFRYCLGTVSD